MFLKIFISQNTPLYLLHRKSSSRYFLLTALYLLDVPESRFAEVRVDVVNTSHHSALWGRGPVGGRDGSVIDVAVSISGPTLQPAVIRLHYNSNLLAFDSAPYGFFGAVSLKADVTDLDGDPSTDRFVEFSAESLSGGEDSNLGTARFVGQPGLDAYALTRVRYTQDPGSVGDTFASVPTVVIGGLSLDIDQNGQMEPLADGLLVVRGLFGFEGASLVNGVVGRGARRTTARDLGMFVQNGRDSRAFDIDGDDQVLPLTDGLLMLRWLFGFRGDQLIQGAVNPNGRRTTAAAVSAVLANLTR